MRMLIKLPWPRKEPETLDEALVFLRRDLIQQAEALRQKYSESLDRYALGQAEQAEADAERIKNILTDWVARQGRQQPKP